MSTQKSLFLEKAHGAFVVGDQPIPEPGPGQILVKIHAAALNPVDWKVQKYDVFVKSYPAVLGGEGAGEVVKVGEGVTNLVPGDKVFFGAQYGNETSTFQQYALAYASFVGKIPANLSYDQAATIPVGLMTAWVGIYRGWGLTLPFESASGLGKYANTPILIIGGSGSVGQFAIQLARASGFSPIIVTSSPKHTDHLKSLGATHVIDRHNSLSTLPEDVSKITPSLLYAFDSVSTPETQQAAYDILSSEGNLLILREDSIKRKDGDGKVIYHVQGSKFAADPLQTGIIKEGFKNWTQWFQTGFVKPLALEILPGGLGGIADGLRRIENNQVSGTKLVAHPWA